jgi:hypothetical protein
MADLRVIAAIEALKTAVLAVNGDRAIVSEIILFDMLIEGGDAPKGSSVLAINICSCPTCMKRTTRMLNQEFEAAKELRRRGVRRTVH